MKFQVTKNIPPRPYQTPHPQNPKNLRKIPIKPPINLLDVFQIIGNDPAERILSSSSSEVDERLLGSGRGGF